MKYKIVADSSSSVMELEGVPYTSVPLKIISEEKEYVDDANLNVFEMLEDFKRVSGPVTTSCPNVYEWKEAFEGADEVYALSITSGMSGSYVAGHQAAVDYMEEHEGTKVFMMDTLSVGPLMRLLMEKLQVILPQDHSFEENVETIKAYRKHLDLVFSVESLQTLARNGRVSPTVAKLAGVLGIRLVGTGDKDNGTLVPLHKARGEKRMLNTMWDEMKKKGYQGGKVRIDHCLNLSAAMELKERVVKEFPDADVQIGTSTGLCGFYSERGGLIVGFEM